jgi:hypothetical protein
MKIFLLLIVLTVASGCLHEAKRDTSVAKSTTPAGSSANVSNSTPAEVKTPEPDEAAGAANFEGTEGITDKKNHINGAAILSAVRLGRHEGFDRLVFEFRDDQLPGYHIEYVDKPIRSCGSREVVPLAGDAWLQIRLEPANAHTDDGKPTLRFREIAPKLPIVLEIKSTCDFEAQIQWVAGVSSPNKYRVLELKNPTRLVVDIKHK